MEKEYDLFISYQSADRDFAKSYKRGHERLLCLLRSEPPRGRKAFKHYNTTIVP